MIHRQITRYSINELTKHAQNSSLTDDKAKSQEHQYAKDVQGGRYKGPRKCPKL